MFYKLNEFRFLFFEKKSGAYEKKVFNNNVVLIEAARVAILVGVVHGRQKA